MIGIKAIPAQFGGFETAVDEISRGLVIQGHELRVYNRSGMSPLLKKVTTVYSWLPSLPSDPKISVLSFTLSCAPSMLHSTLSTCVHYFTTGTTLFAPSHVCSA